MIKTYKVRNNDELINIKANGLCDLEEKLQERKKKIGFILSCRNDYDKSNHKFYRYLFNEYLKMDSEELDIEFNFYFNK